jgi:hypothetical protein
MVSLERVLHEHVAQHSNERQRVGESGGLPAGAGIRRDEAGADGPDAVPELIDGDIQDDLGAR